MHLSAFFRTGLERRTLASTEFVCDRATDADARFAAGDGFELLYLSHFRT